jgi:cytochrome c2
MNTSGLKNEQEVEDVILYLKTLKPEAPAP